MQSVLSIILVTGLAVLAVSCGGAGSGSPDAAPPPSASPTASSQPSGSTAASSQPSGSSAAAPSQPVSLAGTWTGTGVDSNSNTGPNGGTIVTWTLAQTDTNISGTVTTQALNPTDGTCISCHRNKTGTLSGTIAGTTLTLTMSFPAQNPFGNPLDVTPICSAGLTGSASGITQGSLTASYSGADSCEGQLVGGTLTMARQP